jgi:cAMP receptor-like G-protein coupled receptor
MNDINSLFFSLDHIDRNSGILNSTISNKTETVAPIDNYIFPKFKNYTHLAGEEFTLEETQIINLIRLICSSISILGCFFIIVAHFLLWIKFKLNRIKRYSNYSTSSKNSYQSSSFKNFSNNDESVSGVSCHNEIIEAEDEKKNSNTNMTEKLLPDTNYLIENQNLNQLEKIKFSISKDSERDNICNTYKSDNNINFVVEKIEKTAKYEKDNKNLLTNSNQINIFKSSRSPDSGPVLSPSYIKIYPKHPSKSSNLKIKPRRMDTKTLERERINKMGLGNELIFFLIISNLGWCIGSFLGIKGFTVVDKDNSLCQAQAFVQNYFDMSSICWNTIISHITLLGTKLTFSDISKKREKMYLFFIYSNAVPILFSLGPLMTDSYGPAGIWCWIDLSQLDTYSYTWIIIFYLFNWGNIIYSIYALISTSMYFSKRQAEIGNDSEKIREAKYLRKYIFILRIFPLILIITRLSGTMNRLYSMIQDEDSFFLFAFHSTVFSLVGFFNSLIYSYFYRSVFKECCKKKEIESNFSDPERRGTFDK